MQKVSIFSLIFALTAMSAHAAIPSRVQSVQNVARPGLAGITTPVTVAAAANPQAQVAASATPDFTKCQRIFVDGDWTTGTPDAGFMAGRADSDCVAKVEMVFDNGGAGLVVATATVSAGDSLKCNISDFPAAGYLDAAATVKFPADREPTMDDVENVMDREQKQNQAIKTIAGTLVGGVIGNALGSSDPTDTAWFSLNKERLAATGIGAGVGGGAVFASTATGKITGDTIMGATVNAAVGGAIGNMSGFGRRVLMVRKQDNVNYLWGAYQRPGRGVNAVVSALKNDATIKNNDFNSAEEGLFYSMRDGYFVVCGAAKGCHAPATRFMNVKLQGAVDLDEFENDTSPTKSANMTKYCMITTNIGAFMRGQNDGEPCTENEYLMVAGGSEVAGSPEPVACPWTGGNNPKSDWSAAARKACEKNLFKRNLDGTIAAVTTMYNGGTVSPVYQDPSDGKIIDIYNDARLQSTLIGAGVGAGIGGFAANQQARAELDERWIMSVQNYKDSLTKFYCRTGTKYLSRYNDIFIIPAPSND